MSKNSEIVSWQAQTVGVQIKEVATPQSGSEIRADDHRSATHFDKGARSYAAAYNARSSFGHSFRARRSKTQALLGKGPLGDLLDVGGASGVYFDALKAQVRTYHILDVSPQMIEEARNIKSDDARLFCHLASAYKLPFPNEHFDTVIAMGVLEYLDEPWKAFREMARVVRPGGLILVSCPNIKSLMRRMSHAIYRLLRRPSPFAPTLVFSADEVRREVEKLKLSGVCIAGYNAQLLPFPLTWHLKLLSHYLAEMLEPFLGRVGNLWGTGFIVKCEKPSENTPA